VVLYCERMKVVSKNVAENCAGHRGGVGARTAAAAATTAAVIATPSAPRIPI
jgi:hypothetical protein